MRRRDFAKALAASTSSAPAGRLTPTGASTPSRYARTEAEIAVGVWPAHYEHPPLNVLRYGAKGDQTTDDRAAISTAIRVARQAGGGVITFPRANYLIASYDPASPLQVPSIQGDLSIADSAVPVQLYVQNANDIVFDFQGSTLHSNVTSGGSLMVLDGCSNVRMLGPSFSGATVMSTGVSSLGSIQGGSKYADGTYCDIPLTGGEGTGAHATLVCGAGRVSSVEVTYPGYDYRVGDWLSCDSAHVGGAGSGFSVPVTSVTGQGNTPLQAGVHALMILSLTRSSSGIDIIDLTVRACYTMVVVTGHPDSRSRATNISLLGNSRYFGPGEYGICLHNNGDHVVIDNAYVYRVNRPVFFYGVSNVSCNIVADSMNGGFSSLIKAYSRNVRNISLRHRVTNSPGLVTARVGLESQHNPENQELPQTVENIYLEHDESNGGAGFGIELDYWAGSSGRTRTAMTAHRLFDNLVLRGYTRGTLCSNVALQGDARCQINFDHLQFAPPPSTVALDSGRGFVRSRRLTYTPTLRFGATAVDGLVASADYYVEGGLCTVIGSITLSVKNGTGQAEILLPCPIRADSAHLPLAIVLAESGMVDLRGAIIGCAAPASNRLVLFTQGAAGLGPVLDTNFTAHSRLRFQASFPI